jgi:hypothetical protein
MINGLPPPAKLLMNQAIKLAKTKKRIAIGIYLINKY